MGNSNLSACPTSASPEALTDAELVHEVTRRAATERRATAELIRALIEFDRRQLYLGEGYASLFAYCTGALHYSEHGAFNRIEVARAAARWPQLLAGLEDGSLHLAGARLLAPHLTADNIEMALESARHKSKRDIEEIAAALAQRSVLVAIAAEQYRLHLTISRAARDNLRQVQALIGHRQPDANAAVIFEQALALLLEKLQRQRFAATDHPRPNPTQVPPQGGAPAETQKREGDPGGARSRHIPNAVKRAVWKRDDARCAFVGVQGRCTERNFLEFHHLLPYAAGGGSTESNIELRCRAHNVFEAERYLGSEVVAAGRKRRSRRSRANAASGESAESGGSTDPARPGTSSPHSQSDTEPGASIRHGASPDRTAGDPPAGHPPGELPSRGMAWIQRLTSRVESPMRI